MKFKKILFLLIITCVVIIAPRVNAQSISGNTYFYDQQFNVSYGSFPAWSNGFGESGVFPTSTYHTVAKSVNGPYINTVRDIYVSNTDYSFTSGNTYKLSLIFNKGSYLLSSSSALYGLTVNRNLSLCRIYGQSAGNMTCSIDWSVTDESMIATIYMHTTLGGNGFELQIGNLNAGTNMIVYNSSFDYSQGIKLTSADIIKDNSATDSLINNNNQNTQDIINNQNQNTQTIINNQNENTEKEIESQMVCKNYSYNRENTSLTSGYMLNTSGQLVANNVNSVTTNYIQFQKNKNYTLNVGTNIMFSPSYCLYDSSKSLIECHNYAGQQIFNFNFNYDGYIRFSLNNNYLENYLFTGEFCVNGNQALNDTLTDSSTSEATANAEAQFGNVPQEPAGLQDILNTWVNFVDSLSSGTCSPLTVPLPFVEDSITLPCLKAVFQSNFPTFFNLYQVITTGIISYYVILNLFRKIHQLEDPNYDKIEVVNL